MNTDPSGNRRSCFSRSACSNISLTKTEYEILKLFLENRGKVFSREELLSAVWPDDVIVTARTVDVNITRLRKKIGPYADSIVTRAGFGYSFQE